MKNIYRTLSTLSAALTLVCLTGCYDAASKAALKYKEAFACSPDDFAELEELVHKHFSGPDKLTFSDGSESAYLTVSALNELIGAKCPQRVLSRCAGGKEADEYVEASEGQSTTYLTGPLEAFGMVALKEMQFESFNYPRTQYGTHLTSEAQFRRALQCFSTR